MKLLAVIAAGVGVGCAIGVSIGIAAAPYVASLLPYIAALAGALLLLAAAGFVLRYAVKAARVATPYLPWAAVVAFTALVGLVMLYGQKHPPVIAGYSQQKRAEGALPYCEDLYPAAKQQPDLPLESQAQQGYLVAKWFRSKANEEGRCKWRDPH